MKGVRVLGSYVFAEEIRDLIKDGDEFEFLGFVENLDRERCGNNRDGTDTIWVDDLEKVHNIGLICGIGTNQRYKYVEQVTQYGHPFVSLRHPSSHVARSSIVSEGTILSVNTIIAAETTLGRHVIVNRAATIGHHTKFGNFVTISPQANIAGKCNIADGVYVGMGATILDGITIGKGSIIGAGSVVTKDVEPNKLVMGVPAKVVKDNVDGR